MTTVIISDQSRPSCGAAAEGTLAPGASPETPTPNPFPAAEQRPKDAIERRRLTVSYGRPSGAVSTLFRANIMLAHDANVPAVAATRLIKTKRQQSSPAAERDTAAKPPPIAGQLRSSDQTQHNCGAVFNHDLAAEQRPKEP